MKKRVIVIGAGIGGLSAGTYLAMNDFDVTILERNRAVGGLCTGWQRGDYKIDLCIHWLPGIRAGSALYKKWNELTPMKELQVEYPEVFLQVEDVSGNSIRLFTNIERLQAELLNKAPEDQAKIQEMIDGIRKLTHFDLPHEHSHELLSLWQRIREYGELLPFAGVLSEFMNKTLAQYAAEFDNPLLQKTIFHTNEPDSPALLLLLNLALMSKQEVGYPVGGSVQFAQRIADHFTEAGGKILYQQEVSKILVDKNQAVGVSTVAGTSFYADYVVSAADGHSTIFDMLDGRYLSRAFDTFYKNQIPYPSLLFIALGVCKNLSQLPTNSLFPLRKSLVIDPETIIDELQVRVHHYDPTLTPNGKTLVTIAIETRDFTYWEKLAEAHPEKYEAQKQRIAHACIDALDTHFGDIASWIEMVDVATPSTIFKFSHNWKGSALGWMVTPDTVWKTLPHTLPDLRHFYMCGQWIAVGGGLPAVMLSGRDVAELICAAEAQPFLTARK